MYKECKSSLSLYGPKRAIYYIYRIQRLRYCDVNNDIGTIDLPNTVLRLVQASLFPFSFASKLGFLSEILAAFPLFVKKKEKLIELELSVPRCKVKVLGVIQDA